MISHMRDLIKNSKHLLLRRQTNILSAAFVIMVTYGISHLMGLVKTRLLISVFFGAQSSLLDVYYAAFIIPDTIFQLLVIGSLSAAFIPVYTKIFAHREEEAWQVAGISVNLVLIIFSLFSVLIFFFAQPLSRLIAPGFSPNQILTMVSLVRVMLLAQIFFCVSGFLTGIIQSHQRFLIPALAPILYNLGIIIGTLFLSPILGIYGPAIGVVIGAFLHMLIQLPLAFRLGFRFVTSLNFRHPAVREIIFLMSPRVLALGIDQVEQFVAVILSSLLSAGSLTLFNVARLLYALPVSLFGVTIGQAALPTLSHQAATADKTNFLHTLLETITQIVFLTLPAGIMFIVLRIPIVRLVFGAKSFPWSATIITGQTLAILAISSAFAAVMQLAIRGFYALHDTKTPLWIGFFAAIFDVVISVWFVTVLKWEVLGLAVAISLTTIIECCVLTLLLYQKIQPGKQIIRPITLSLFKIIFCGLATGISLWVPMRLLDRFVFDTTRTLPLLALTATTTIIGFGVYFTLSYLFKITEISAFFALIRRFTNLKRYLSSH